MLQAQNLFTSLANHASAPLNSIVEQAMQHGKIDAFTSRFFGTMKQTAEDFKPWTNPIDDGTEFADYSEGADKPVEDTAEPEVQPAPVTIIEETVIIEIIEVVEEPEVPSYDEPENTDDYEYTDEDDYEYTNEDDYEYYENYEEYGCEDCYENGYEPPSKGDLGLVVGAAAFQTIMPMLFFNALEQKAYKDYYGEYEPEDYDITDEDGERLYETENMRNWDTIQGLNILTWGPMLILGCFSLSGNFQDQSAWWLENVISNLYMPVMIGETYFLAEYAVLEGGWQPWTQLVVFSLANFTVLCLHMDVGTDALSFLRGIEQTDSLDFVPSLFYKLGWMTHDDDETYPY